MITIEAPLSCDAEYRVRLDKSAAIWLSLVLDGLLFEVQIPCGSRPEAHIAAQNLARKYRRGATTGITCTRLRWRTDHGAAAFVVDAPISVLCSGDRLL